MNDQKPKAGHDPNIRPDEQVRQTGDSEIWNTSIRLQKRGPTYDTSAFNAQRCDSSWTRFDWS